MSKVLSGYGQVVESQSGRDGGQCRQVWASDTNGHALNMLEALIAWHMARLGSQDPKLSLHLDFGPGSDRSRQAYSNEKAQTDTASRMSDCHFETTVRRQKQWHTIRAGCYTALG